MSKVPHPIPRAKRFLNKCREALFSRLTHAPDEFVLAFLGIGTGELSPDEALVLAGGAVLNELMSKRASASEISEKISGLRCALLWEASGRDSVFPPEGFPDPIRNTLAEIWKNLPVRQWKKGAVKGRLDLALESQLAITQENHLPHLREYILALSLTWDWLTSSETCGQQLAKTTLEPKGQETRRAPISPDDAGVDCLLVPEFKDFRDTVSVPQPQRGSLHEVGKSLVRRKLPHVPLGATKLFQRKAGAGTRFTQGTILVDCSASMRFERDTLDAFLRSSRGGMVSVWLWTDMMVALVADGYLRAVKNLPRAWGGTPAPIPLMMSLRHIGKPPYVIISDYDWSDRLIAGPPRGWTYPFWYTQEDGLLFDFADPMHKGQSITKLIAKGGVNLKKVQAEVGLNLPDVWQTPLGFREELIVLTSALLGWLPMSHKVLWQVEAEPDPEEVFAKHLTAARMIREGVLASAAPAIVTEIGLALERFQCIPCVPAPKNKKNKKNRKR